MAPTLLIRAAWLNGLPAAQLVARFATAADRRYAAAFRRPTRQRQALLARALLRSALAQLVPAAWRLPIDTGDRPPRLGGAGARLGASIAHSRDLVAIALGAPGAVGIDIEFLKPGRDIHAVARGMGWPETDAGAFYRRWTRDEAYFKAAGRHLDGEPPSGWHLAARTIKGAYALAAAWHPGPAAPPGCAALLRAALGQAAPMPRW